jgi:hypothetical protein
MTTPRCLTNAPRCGIALLSFAIVFHLSTWPTFADAPASYIVAQDDYGGENGNPGGAIRGEPYAQTFTATTGGTLFSMAAGFLVPYTPSDPYYIFQFRDTTAGGLPSTQVIASVNVPTASLAVPPAGGGFGLVNLTADFSSFGISLSAGHKYALSIDVPGPSGTTIYNDFFWGETGSPYAGGASYYMSPSGAMSWSPTEPFLFTIEAVPVPEPSPVALAMSAALCAQFFRSRRRQGISPDACR